MKINNCIRKSFKNEDIEPYFGIDQRIAYHMAGHAAGIGIGNYQKQLPDVHFQIIIKLYDSEWHKTDRLIPIQGNYTATLEGGRLIQSLPLSLVQSDSDDSGLNHQKEYRKALQADIFNLMAGPLAEAKFVTTRDNEMFTPNLVNFEALKFYGSNSDLNLINEYLECLNLHQPEAGYELNKLYLAAFNFINKKSNWNAISAIANYIIDRTDNIIQCEELTSLLSYQAA